MSLDFCVTTKADLRTKYNGYPMISQNTMHRCSTTAPLGLHHLSQLQVANKRFEQKWHFGVTLRLARVLGAIKNKFSLVILVLLALPVLALPQNDPLSPAYLPSIDTNAADYPSNIWITDTMQKVRQNSGSPGTQHWGRFYGTQNEFVDFQVHVQAPAGGISNLTVTASDFVQSSPSSYTISASSTNIIVYREEYINVSPNVTATSSTYYGVTGYYPDILIPNVDPYYHQTTNAWPFTVAASNNQSAWVDVLIPSDAPAGYYLGSVLVQSGCPGSCVALATMPVTIAVWQWPSAGHMPSTATLPSYSHMTYAAACIQFYGSYSACGSYPGATTLNRLHGGSPADAGSELSIIDQAVLLLDHRYSVASVINTTYQSATTPGTEIQTYWGPLYNGTAAANTSTILSGAKVTSTALGQGTGVASPQAGNWATFMNTNSWMPLYFAYSYDEPPPSGSPAAWSAIATNAGVLHATTPKTPALVTTWLDSATTNSALNNIDWMVVAINILEAEAVNGGGGLQRSTYNKWLAGNCCGAGSPTRQLWSYQTCSSSGTCTNGIVGSGITYPNYNIDGVPAANRAMEWMTFFHQQSGELYNDTVSAWDTVGKNPWTSSSYQSGGWGESNLIYPSTSYPTNYVLASGGTALTHPIFLPSIRLKHIRDGMQDYEYLYKLNALGQGTYVNTQITNWITNSYTFETTGKGLLAARIALGTALHQLSYPVRVSPPTNLIGTVQ